MKLVKIGDIAEQIRGVSYKPIDVSNEPQEGKIPLLRSNNIHDAVVDYTDVIYVNRSVVSPQQMLIPGDVLICASSGSKNLVGKASLVIEKKGSFGAFCKVLRLHENDGNRYFYHFFCSPHYRTMISNLSAGANINNIRNEHLDEMYIPWPEIEKRAQKGKILDTITSLISLRRQQLEKLNQLAKSQFVEMFGDPIENPRGWPVACIRDCVDKIENGKSPVCENVPRQGQAPAVLKLSSISSGNFRPEENKALPSATNFNSCYEVKPGDLLISRKNTYELVGMACYVCTTPPGLQLPDLIFRLKLKPVLRGYYLAYLFNHAAYRPKVQALAGGSAGSMPNISKQRLMELMLPIPPDSLQKRFEDILNHLDKSKFAIEESIKKLELLYRSKLQEYFG